MRGEILYPGDLSYFFLLSYCFLSGPSCSVPSVFACQLYKLGHRLDCVNSLFWAGGILNRGTKFCLLQTCLSQTLRWTFKRNNDASNETKTLHQYNTSIVQTLLLLNPSCHRPSDKQSVRQLSLVTFSVLCEVLNSFHSCFPVFSTTFPRVRNAASVQPVVQLAQSTDTEIQVQITLLRYSRECILLFSCTTGSSSRSRRIKVADIFECGIFLVVIIAFVRIDF
ncbi:hypothetical protein T08_8494 [Trichinella sp. T8]|nr:hypothetical protein T08_8494 [Trichinella sp. T8]